MDESNLLDRLAMALQTAGMPTQIAIARAVGVDQPLVSRARRGELKRVTTRVRALCEYAERRAAEINELEVERARRVKRKPSLAHDVLKDCRHYLSDGCDPAVLRDQLRVLRRAQGRL